ncbi:MAG: pantetheine-phosphate adenylyltransferase [Clostridia bacterium]|nr:pantetheine-phosphate adenylyltransferase [Clostridia bacterium]
MNKRPVAIVTGSFDPVTVGHVEIVRRAATMFDRVYVVALSNREKQHRFTSAERKEMLRLAMEEIPGVTVDAYEGMTADYMHAHGITTIVRGVRGEDDRAYEQYVAERMREFDPAFETVLLPAGEGMEEISSTSAREAIEQGDDLSPLLPPKVADYIRRLVNP